MSEKQVAMTIDLPSDVKDWLRAEVARMGSSQRSEIIRALRQRMDAEREKAVR
ncbi:Arc domain-containing protein [Bradyrhizobium sp. Cp5.3]|uniref:Arc domain-containing protein n=1 Tax=Bradyrhizobium sp. Cp5.3 TaxID=443598 RepID=UPI0003F7EA97|nr:Arc domain-containing protein [Bradyrhizobium sp. Cp5.3]